MAEKDEGTKTEGGKSPTADHQDVGQQQTDTLNDADWNQQSDEQRRQQKIEREARGVEN